MKQLDLRNIWNGLWALLGGLALCSAMPVWGQATDADESAATQSTNSPAAEADATESAATNTLGAEAAGGMKHASRRHSYGHGEPLVSFGGNVEVKPNETKEVVVVIGGTARVRGQVTAAVVVIGGSAEISGEVGQNVVSVCGSVKLMPGAQIHGDTVTVCGNLEVQDGASVDHDAVCVLGKLNVARPGAVQGKVVNVLAAPFPSFEPFRKFFTQCVLKLRPLAPSVGWMWPVAGVFLLLYVLVAVAFPRPVQHCLDELTRRPATTFLFGLLTKMLIPILTLILVATGIGIFIVPFLGAAVLCAGIVGKVALLQYFGQQLGKQFSRGVALQPLVALLIGAALLTVLYVVPVLGLLALLTTGLWALGAAVMALFGGMRREMPERAQPPASPPPAAAAPLGTPEVSAQPPVATAGLTPAAPPMEAPPATPPTPEAWSLPRAGFWERMGAAFLDMILVGILSGLVGRGPLGLMVTLAYFSGMWAWKGTTVGGVVLKLKVVRLDGQPITFPVALVRGLAGAFSIVVMFLGFLWIAWDKDKQGWHDKIAGTVVVRLPHTQSLVCF